MLNVNLTPGTNVVTVALNPGSYLGEIATYDGPVTGTPPATSGNILSENQSFPITVAAGKANVPTITLDGVPSTNYDLQFTNLSPNMLQIQYSPGSSPPYVFRVAEPSASVMFTVSSYDARGNLIMGPGAPTFSVTSDDGFTASISGANVVSLGAPSAATGVQPPLLTFSTSAPGCPPGGCSWTEYAGFNSLLAIADQGANDVLIETTETNLTDPILATIKTNGIPGDVKFDLQGNLFISDEGGNAVTEYAPPYTGTPRTTIAGLASPSQIALESGGGYLAVVNAANVVIYALPHGKQAPVAVLNVAANAVAFDPVGNLWVATSNSGVIEYASGTLAATGIVANANEPTGIGFDNHYNLYIANSGNGTVTEQFPNNYTGGPNATATVAGVNSLVVLPSSSTVIACGTNMASVYVGAFSFYEDLTSGSSPCQATIDVQETIWLSDRDTASVLGYPNTGSLSSPIRQPAGFSPGPIDAYPLGQ